MFQNGYITSEGVTKTNARNDVSHLSLIHSLDTYIIDGTTTVASVIDGEIFGKLDFHKQNGYFEVLWYDAANWWWKGWTTPEPSTIIN